MKVGIVTTAKFHYFALARHLQKNGMLARIVCGYPKSKLASEGIEESKLVSFPWYSAPHMGLLRFGRSGSVVRELEWLSNIQLSRYASGLVQDLDVLIAASGTGLEAGRTIKEKGGTFICDRGAAHIAVQNEILRQEYEALGIEWPGIDPRKIDRELAEYELADQIFVPSQQVKRTFVESGVDPSKIEVLRLGAELARFTPSMRKLIA
jgi:hypothetical protein